TWARTRMPREPQPVPPIYQPEVAAKAIVWAARHPRRELMVAWPTVKAILGNAVAPGLADRYLARSGYDAQQRDEPLDPARPDNLFTAVGWATCQMNFWPPKASLKPSPVTLPGASSLKEYSSLPS